MVAENRAKRIFIVDDEKDLTEIFEYKLRKESFDTKAVNDPLRSIDEARIFSPDLIVLDVMMPGINGFQLCRILRANQVFAHTPIIFMTACNDVEDRVRAFEYGCNGYLFKPVEVAVFIIMAYTILQ